MGFCGVRSARYNHVVDDRGVQPPAKYQLHRWKEMLICLMPNMALISNPATCPHPATNPHRARHSAGHNNCKLYYAVAFEFLG
ncbi:hypothetical protein BDV11DRAFT_136107 [Aspergillus similis]